MSDKYFIHPTKVAPATVKGTPDMGEELRYRLVEEKGRHVVLGSQFEKNYECGEHTKKRNDFDPEMFGIYR
jgi:hypothetical protein